MQTIVAAHTRAFNAKDFCTITELMAPSSGKCDAAWRKLGLHVTSEGCADRAYNADGTLVSRKHKGSLISDPERAAHQAVKMATEGRVCTIDGAMIDMLVQTIFCHGDTPETPEIVCTVRAALEKAGCRVRPLQESLAA